MPANYTMTWESGPRRWRKVYKGTTYTVSCRDLGAMATKEASYQAANSWWLKKRAEIDTRQRFPNQDVVEGLIKQRDEALDAGAWPEAEELHGKIVRTADHQTTAEEVETIVGEETNDQFMQRIMMAKAAGITIPKDADPKLLDYLFGETRIQIDRKRIRPKTISAAEKNLTMASHVKNYLDLQEGRLLSGDICPGEHQNNSLFLRRFERHVGSETPVTAIDATTLETYYTRLKKEVQARKEDPVKKAGLSTSYAFQAFGFSRAFIRYLWSKGVIELPRNMDYRGFTFKRPPKAVPTMSIPEVRHLIDNAHTQLKLHLLLMTNCGMTQTDVSDLRDDEVDWEQGRIRRKRSKTSDHEDVPLVDYKLWPLTFKLLKQWRSGGEIVLLTKYGTRWVWEEWKDGKYRGNDSIVSIYRYLNGKLLEADPNFQKRPIKLLRKTSASLIEGHREYGRYKTHFLGHSPVGIADRHYAAPSTVLFDEIVAWLGKEYGLVE